MPHLAAQKTSAQIGDHVIALAWAPDGASLAAASVSGPLALFAPDLGERWRGPGHRLGTCAIAWHPRRPLLASSGQDRSARLWDTGTGNSLAELEGGASWVEHVSWSPDGVTLVTGAGRELRFWDDRGGRIPGGGRTGSTIAALQWRGKAVLAAGYGGVSFWRPGAERAHRSWPFDGSILAMAVSPDGKFVATGNQDGSVHFWFAKSGDELEMSGYPGKVRELAWDGTSRYLATGGSPVIVLWDCGGKGPRGRKPGMLEAHAQPLSALAYQRTGQLLASGGADGKVALWSPTEKTQPLAQHECGSGVTQLAWSPDDKRLAIGTENGALEVIHVVD